MFLRDPFIGAFGLDIGDLSVKLVRLARSKKINGSYSYTLKDLRSVALQPGWIVNGEIIQPELVRKKITWLLGRTKNRYTPITTPWVVADLPEPQTFIKIIEIKLSPDDVTADDIRAEAVKHLPFELDDAYLDWQMLNGTDLSTTKVLLSAAPKAITEAYMFLLESSGLKPVALEIEAAALARALITATKNYSGSARAILDLGATRSSLIIYDHNTLQFSTSLPFSGELITEAIAERLKVSHDEAELLKFKFGQTHNPTNIKYLPAVADITDQLIKDIKSGLQFYKDHFTNSNPVTHITLTGGTSNLLNLNAVIARKLKISTSHGSAWKNLQNLKPLTPEQTTSATTFASAIGLALRAAQKPW